MLYSLDVIRDKSAGRALARQGERVENERAGEEREEHDGGAAISMRVKSVRKADGRRLIYFHFPATATPAQTAAFEAAGDEPQAEPHV